MNYRKIGTSDIEVSEISLGCWTMGGLNWVNGTENGWANVNEDEITKAIKLALETGVNHFDNADVYGNGRAERMLASVLKKLGINSNELVISTKLGHFPGTAGHAYEPAHIRHQCEQSLINLQRDYIDIYYFHHGNFGKNDKYLHDAIDTMQKFIQRGKVRICGLSAYSNDDFSRLVPQIRPSVLQSWAHILDDQFIREGSTVQKLMAEYDLSFVAFSPMAQARLLDKYDPENPPTFDGGDHRRTDPDFQREAIAVLKPKLQKLREKFGDSTEDLASVALNYVLSAPNVACVIPGFRNEKQVKCNLSASGHTLNTSDLEYIRSIFA